MPSLRGALPDYPWESLAPYIARARAHPDGAVDLSIGSPVDPAPEVARTALIDAADAHAYPATAGSAPLISAIIEWYERRRGVRLDERQVLPTIGSKEFVALLPMLLGIGPGEVVVHPRISYPSYAMGAALVGAQSLAADDPDEWPESARLIWLNSPSNPDGRVLDVPQLSAAVARARELGAVIVGDECYAEFGWQDQWTRTRIPSLLDPRVVGESHDGVLAAYSLSKQSNLAGYRAAFVAGDAELIASLLNVRKHAGLMPPAPVQAAAVAVLGDEAHVDRQREVYRARRNALLPALAQAGYRIDGSEAGLYLWATRGVDAWQSIDELAELGIIAGPGHFYGEHSPHHVRFSLTAHDTAIDEGVKRLMAADPSRG